MASVWTFGDDRAWSVAETPSEVAEIVDRARVARGLVALTLANEESSWNGRTVYLAAEAIQAISPPLSERDSDA